LQLSRQRAEAVKWWLVNRAGVREARLTTVGYGQDRPVADNSTEAGRAQNRRVELVRK
jgi:OOP family OmpA-OmpF porin